MKDSTISISISVPNEQVGIEISELLVSKKLVACAHIFPIKSIYTWEGKVEKEGEFLLRGKSFLSKMEEIEEEVLKVHPYDIPEITAIPIVHVLSSYEQWMKEVIT